MQGYSLLTVSYFRLEEFCNQGFLTMYSEVQTLVVSKSQLPNNNFYSLFF